MDPDEVRSQGISMSEIAPLLTDVETSNMPPTSSIFSISRSHSRRSTNPKETSCKAETDMEDSFLDRFFLWAWDGSRFSGVVCVALASALYWMMEFLATTFLEKPIPLFEIVLVRCTIMLILSFMWLRRMGRPVFGSMSTTTILISRALVGYFSLVCFIYSVHNVPLHYATMVNLATPTMASVAARLLLEEKLSLPDIGGLTCSFVGIVFLYHPIFSMQGASTETGHVVTVKNNNLQIVPLLVGILSSFTGAISYCLVRSGAKATEEPVLTVLAFGAIACPLSAICGFFFEKFILVDLYTFVITAVLGIFAFFAEVLLARGLQLEKTCKATNILYLQVFLTQMSSIAFFKAVPSFCRLLGCLLLVMSICITVYFGPFKAIS